MPAYILDNIIFTVSYNYDKIAIDAVYGPDVYRATIDGQSIQSYDIVCEIFDTKNVKVSKSPYVMLLNLPCMENHMKLLHT